MLGESVPLIGTFFGEVSRAVKHHLAPTWTPQKSKTGEGKGPQELLVEDYRDLFEIFFGGARGGGKTDGMIGDWMIHEQVYGKYARGVFFRRFYIDLEDVRDRAREILLPLGYKWNGASGVFRAPSGATLKLRHCKDEKIAERYQGHKYTRVYMEELPQWPTSGVMDLLRATLRSADGVKVGLRATGNPGNRGHHWVKARYIDPMPPLTVRLDSKTQQPLLFIPSRLEDNLILMKGDPTYEARLLGVGRESLARGWRWGEWDQVEGAYFANAWDASRSVLKPFRVPLTWKRFRSFDWGSAKPASLGEWAISDGTEITNGPYRGKMIPRGSLVRVSEIYFCDKDESGATDPNVGLRLTNGELGAQIAKHGEGIDWSYGVADPSIWTEDGGPSIYDQMNRGAIEATGKGLGFTKADNSRITGWSRLLQLMKSAVRIESERGEDPGIYIFETCREFLRTVPILEPDERDPEDIDSASEDHVADEARYACMSIRLNPPKAGAPKPRRRLI